QRPRHREPAPRPPRPEHDQALLRQGADQDRDGALPRSPDRTTGGTAAAAAQKPREAGMTPLCLPVEDWPEIDRERWRRAQDPAGFLEADEPATRWSAARRRIGEQRSEEH